jgi:integrase
MARYTVQTATGPKRKALFYGKTRAEVSEKLTKAMADRDGGIVYDAGSMTVGEYMNGWLRDSLRGTVRASTVERHEINIRVHIIPVLGQLKLKALAPERPRSAPREAR